MRFPGSRDRVRVDVVEDDLGPGLERHLGDPGAHHAAPTMPTEPIPRRTRPARRGARPRSDGLIASNGWRHARQ